MPWQINGNSVSPNTNVYNATFDGVLERVMIASAALALMSANASAGTPQDDYFQIQQSCSIKDLDQGAVQTALKDVTTNPKYNVNGYQNGGLFSPNNIWAAVVDRKGVVCFVFNNNKDITSSVLAGATGTKPKPGDAWPGSRALALAKAFTANGYSNNKLAVSTANMYTPTALGGSPVGSNPFNPAFMPQGTGIGHVVGGIITDGGGVALYKNGEVIGALGVCGDTACADHAIAYRVRRSLGLQPTVPGPNSNHTDNIEYPQGHNPPSNAQQPHCLGAGIDVVP